MGLSFSCPIGDLDDLDSRFQTVLLKSISFEDGEGRTALRSVSFNGRDSERTVMESYGSGKTVFEGSLSFKNKDLETVFSFKTPRSDKEKQVPVRALSFERTDNNDTLQRADSLPKNSPRQRQVSEPVSRKYQAALKLQKVYKSFRTRRQLADCAVLVEQRWWKLLDFAELKRSSISFFDIQKPETALSRWSRARKRAAKVGKGLSKDEKARKLALQHWLEAIDPRHRYGHNLQFYYVKWLHCDSKQPFFYWVDIGEGKEVNIERCPRSKLQQQCIKYLGPTEREAYEVVIKEGKLVYKNSRELLDTRGGPTDTKWIFVLSTSKTLYVGQKKKGTFQHSSFLAGGATLSAGRLVVVDGILKAVWPHSGHYLPTEENFEEFMSFLMEHNVDLTNVTKSPSEDEEECITRKGSGFGDNQSEAEGLQEAQKITNSRELDCGAAEDANQSSSRLSKGFGSKITKLQIPARQDVFDIFKKETLPPSCRGDQIPLPRSCRGEQVALLSCRGEKSPIPRSYHAEQEQEESPSEDGYETAEEVLSEEEFMYPKANLFGEDEEEDESPRVPKEKIMKRIDSHKGMKSYQLAQQLSSKWSTGAGPRISCMRDYPPELQFRILEQANLSPGARSASMSPRTALRFSPRVMTPSSLRRETIAARSPLAPEQVAPPINTIEHI